MHHETLILKVPGDSTPLELISYLPDNSDQIDPDRTRKTVLLCPGGGYYFLSDRESEPVALRLVAAGFNVFTVRYHVAPEARFPIPQLDLAYAVHYIRTHAEEYHVRKDRIIVMGFSAGGHLACSLAVWYREELFRLISDNPDTILPDGLILCYPVITGGEFTHAGSMKNLYNTNSRSAWESRSLEHYVHDRMPPVFLWTTYEDKDVPVENTFLLAQALRENGISLEMHVFPHGPHGLSLDSSEVFGPNVTEKPCCPEIQMWIDLAIRWLNEL